MFPLFGAQCVAGGVVFRLLVARDVDVRLVLQGGAAGGEHRMTRVEECVAEVFVPGIGPGQRYRYRLHGSDLRPDPASRFQPDGVHGASEVVDPAGFAWRDEAWTGIPPAHLIVYELHVGTFTPEGTFAAARDRLPELRDLGITAVELMPVADFAGARNWGYDGVALYAPCRAYGRPDDLRALVDGAHALGLAVILDVVYNHLGPEGAYLPQFYPDYLAGRHATPWGSAVNLDGPGSDAVRRFIADNAVHWTREYHLDGLRLDATHALIDEGPTHLVRELTRAVAGSASRPVMVHAEDHRNLDAIVRADVPGGWGCDGVWADDFHHIVRRLVAGDAHGYYEDFEGTVEELIRTIRQGWLYTGAHSVHMAKSRGTDPAQVPMHRFIVCVQNHDQVGNRALGDRLHARVDAATWRALSTLLLTVPMTPLLFMGQEWAASSPFCFFTDLELALGRLVTQGRRQEFKAFPEFADPLVRERIPDPQADSTFDASRLRWEERSAPHHSAVLALYRALIALRRTEPALAASSAMAGEAHAVGEDSLVIRRSGGDEEFHVAVRLRGRGEVSVRPEYRWDRRRRWDIVLSTEDPRFALDPHPARIQPGHSSGGPVIRFERPGAVIFRS